MAWFWYFCSQNNLEMKINIGIEEKNTQKVTALLSKLLADEFVLYTKTRNAHWNLEGEGFHGLHVFFEEQFNQLDNMIDTVAERIRAIGHFAPGSLKQFLALTQLNEGNAAGNSGTAFIKTLLEDHLGIIIFLRENIDPFAAGYRDYASSDLLTGLLSDHEKMVWMLNAHLKV